MGAGSRRGSRQTGSRPVRHRAHVRSERADAGGASSHRLPEEAEACLEERRPGRRILLAQSTQLVDALVKAAAQQGCEYLAEALFGPVVGDVIMGERGLDEYAASVGVDGG